MDNTDTIYVLGAADPEMERIEFLLRQEAQNVVYATDAAGNRVTPAGAYSAHCTDPGLDRIRARGGSIVLVECDLADPRFGTHSPQYTDCAALVSRVDHHRPGDPGYGRPPAEYLAASSLGQTLALMGLRPTDHDLVIAAADHCLSAAYRGECGVAPDTIARWRAESRAAFQKVTPEEMLARIEAACAELRSAPQICLMSVADMPHTEDHGWESVCDGCAHDEIYVADMRRDTPVPELVEAACRLDAAYISGPLIGRDGRRKYTVSGRAEHVSAFFNWAERKGLVDAYGDPARGFGGAYEAE